MSSTRKGGRSLQFLLDNRLDEKAEPEVK